MPTQSSSGDKSNKTNIIKKKALDGYARYGTVTAACEYARINRSTWYEWVKKDADFKAQVEAAEEQVTDRIEQTATQKAVAGDTTLLIFMLKNRRREKYADRHEISGPDGGPIELDAIQKLDARITDIAKRRRKKVATQEPDPGRGYRRPILMAPLGMPQPTHARWGLADMADTHR